MKTFKIGGVHLPEHKLSALVPIQKAALPKRAVVMFGQNVGAASIAVVAKGDKVKVGQLIAKAGGFIGSNLHAPVSGTIEKISKVPDADGYKKPAIIIHVEGDEWLEGIDTSPKLIKNITLNKEEIITAIAEAGIVGLGGATFPTHVKLTPPPEKPIEVLLIDAVECEPYLTADHQLMLEKGEEILVGITILMKALSVERAVIGIEANKPDIITHLSILAQDYKGIEVCPLKVRYPQGSEKQLIEAVIQRRVPSGALPMDVGAIVQNVGTAFAVYEAVQKNKPLIERVITVTGKKLAKPSNFLARIGTPLSQLIDAAGGIPEGTGKIVCGGPMMGIALSSPDVPMTKGHSGVLLIPSCEAQRKEVNNCIRCAKCVHICCMGLQPYLLMSFVENDMLDKAQKEHVMDCIECGSCLYVCPSNRPLLDYIRLGKSRVKK